MDTMRKLRAEIEALRKENQSLRDGSCRFHCRTVNEAFLAGYMADAQAGEHSEEAARMALREWKRGG